MNRGLLHLLKANVGADPISKDQISQPTILDTSVNTSDSVVIQRLIV